MRADGVPDPGDFFDLYKRIGEVVRRNREARGWTQAGLARRIESWAEGAGSQGTISRLELGERAPRVDEAYALAMEFKIPVVELIGITTPPKPGPIQLARDLLAALEEQERKNDPFTDI